MSAYATLRPRLELLEVLGSIAAYQDAKWDGKGPRWGRVAAWCIVRQREIIAWWAKKMKRHGYQVTTMARSTLNYQLAGLCRDRYIARERRHTTRRGSRKLDLRPTLYKFTTLGQLWIKRRLYTGANVVGPLAVQKIGQSGFNYDVRLKTSLSSAVDKASTAPKNQNPRKGRAELRRRTSSSANSRAVQAPGKPLSRKSAGRATIAQAARNGQRQASRTRRRPRSS